MIKKPDAVLREYVRSLSDMNLETIHMCISQSFCGDRATAANMLSEVPAIDRWLSSAEGATDWFDMVDYVGEFTKKELSRRSNESKRRDEDRTES
jgi:hypothetical protein